MKCLGVMLMRITCSEAYKKNEPMPADMNLYVLIQRHAALAWVTMYARVMDDGEWGVE